MLGRDKPFWLDVYQASLEATVFLLLGGATLFLPMACLASMSVPTLLPNLHPSPQSPQQQQQQPLMAQAAASDGSNASACTAGAAGGDGDELAVAFQEDLTLSVREGEPTTLTAGQVKGMTPQELAGYYKAYVNELAGCLVETSGQPASPERIRCLVDEVCLLCTRVALCNPAGVKHFTLTKVGRGPAQRKECRGGRLQA